MSQIAMIVGVAVVSGLATLYGLNRYCPFRGWGLFAYRFAWWVGIPTLLCFVGALLIEVPDSRGLFVVLALVAIGIVLARTLDGKTPPRQPLNAETQQAQQQAPQGGGRQPQRQPDISRYTVRSAPAVAGGGVRSARVRRIQAMEGNSGN